MEDSSKLLKLQDELSEALFGVSIKRNEVPVQCAKLLSQNLQLQQQNAESVIFLPKQNLKKVACRYPLDKSLDTILNLNEGGESTEEVYNFISQVREDQLELMKVIEMTKKRKPIKS